MANTSIQFSFDAIGVQKVREDLTHVVKASRAALTRIRLAKAKKRLQRAYLNMLRAPRSKRKDVAWRWELAKLYVKACEMRVESPTAEIRIISRNIRKGEPVVFIETVFARGATAPTTCDRRTVLLGPRLHVAEIDECPTEILASTD